MIRKFKLPDNGIPIRVGDSSFIYKDVYHPIEWFGGEPYRPRVETLVLTPSGVDMLYMEKKEENHYRIPGGSIDSDSSFEKQAENETNEEALLKVTDVTFANVVYHQPMDKDYIAKGGDGCIPYVGSTTHVYTAYRSGTVDKSTIEEKDLDDDMAKNGKFYPIRLIGNILRVDHIKALINSGRIRDKAVESLLYKRLNTLMTDQPPTTIFETMGDVVAETETKYIYHGSTHDIDVFHPMSLDLGNGEQEPGWSTFCFRSYTLAKRFAIMRMIQKYLGDGNDPMRKCNWDLKKSKPYLHHSVYAEVLNGIAQEKYYVYTIDAEPLELGIGNDERFPEVTFREDNVVPYRKDVLYADEDSIRDHIEIIRERPDIYEKRQMDDIDHLNRGWVTCMLNRDYSGDSAVAKLTKAVSNGKLNPGDDVSSYMTTNGIVLKDISFIERMSSKSVEEAFDLSDEFEETIILGDHRALYTSEWKKEAEISEEDCCDEDVYLPSSLPPEAQIIHKGFLYELHIGGVLTPMGQYDIVHIDDPDANPLYFLRLMVSSSYLKLGIGSVLAGYAIRYQKKNLSAPLIAEIPNSSWEKTGIRNWIKRFGNTIMGRTDISVAVKLDNVDSVAMESSNQNLTNLSWYHTELVRPGFNPKTAGGWDEELYSKTIDHAVRQTFMGEAGKDKELLKKKSVEMYAYTAGEELSSIYLGKLTVYFYGLDDNGYMPKLDWEWAEQEDFRDSFLLNLREEIHPSLEGTNPFGVSYVKNFKPKGKLSLSNFKKLKATYDTVSSYRNSAKVLTFIEKTNVDNGCIWVDANNDLVAVCTVEYGLLDKFNEITALEVSDKYKGYGLGNQALDYAVKTLKGNTLMVEADNPVAKAMYEKYGFKASRASAADVMAGIRHTYFMYLPSGMTRDRIKDADQVRIGPDPVGENISPEDVDIVDATELDELDIVEEASSSKLLEPIFIVCTFTGTAFGKVVTKIQHCKFSHSGLSLDSKLKKIYTFNTSVKKSGGAGIETIDGYNNVSTGGDGDICVMCFFVPPSVKEKVRHTIDYIFSNADKTRYAFGNLFNILMNRAVDTKNSMQMVCSQFVDYCLKVANIDITKKSSNLVSPNDFVNVPKHNPKVFVLFDGKKSAYKSNTIDRKINHILRTKDIDDINVVAEGTIVTERIDSQHITFSKSSSAIKDIVSTMSEKEHFYIGADSNHQIYNEINSFYKEVLSVGGIPVSFIMVFETSKTPGIGHIIIGTRADYRRKGYGQILINRMRSAKFPDRIKTLSWGYDKGNDASEKLARKMGFNEEGEPYKSGKIPLRLHTESFQGVTESSLLNKRTPKGLPLYHGSSTQGLKYIDPKSESFDAEIGRKDLVFASDDPRFCACFAVKWHDDIARQGTWDHWKTVTFGVSNKVDLDKPCSLYELENDGTFIQTRTKEFVANHKIKVKNETKFKTGRDMLMYYGVEIISLNEYKRRLGKPASSTYDNVEPVSENVVFNKSNTAYNVDKFESGKSNILLVTGLSGSGKSTLAEKIAKEYKAEWIELDIFEHCYGFTDDSLKEAGEVFYEYLSSHKELWNRLKAKEAQGKYLATEINKFIRYCFSWCKEHKDAKWIIEGVQLYSCMTADEVTGYPLIIMGTSAKNSILQRFKRNGGGKIEWGKELKNEFPNLIKWYWDEEKTLTTFKNEVNDMQEFTLPEQGDFDAYMSSVDLNEARESISDRIMEGWLSALLEAKKDEGDDGLPSLGKDDKTGDYSNDAEKSMRDEGEPNKQSNDQTDGDTDELDDEGTDYTEDAEEENEQAEDEPQDDNTDDEGSNDTGDDIDAGTDYTADADGSGNSGSGDDSGEEPSGTEPEQTNDTQSGNNGVKNYTLLTDFESLYRLASEISDTIEPIIMEKPIQNKVLTQVRSNLSAIKASIMKFITLHFKADDYAFNLYYYEIFIGLLSKNLEILEKNRRFSSEESKKNEKNNKE